MTTEASENACSQGTRHFPIWGLYLHLDLGGAYRRFRPVIMAPTRFSPCARLVQTTPAIGGLELVRGVGHRGNIYDCCSVLVFFGGVTCVNIASKRPVRGKASVYARLHYAFNETLSGLRAVFSARIDYEVVQVFVLTVGGFGALAFAIDADQDNLIASLIVGTVAGIFFFLIIIGLIILICVIFIFVYCFTVGINRSGGFTITSKWYRFLKFVFGTAVGGVSTIAVLWLLYQESQEFVLNTQLATLLPEYDDLAVWSGLTDAQESGVLPTIIPDSQQRID